jgi:D-aminoacyl-tRNA deacylase
MRALIQRVNQAQVEVSAQTIGRIDRGLLILLGITHQDDSSDIDYLIRKIINLRIFNDEAGKMNLSVQEVGGGLLVVSQFTLYGNTQKGNRPAYTRSAGPEVAIPLYERFVAQLQAQFPGPVATGEFGASMQVTLCNDGPVTLMLDSRMRDG